MKVPGNGESLCDQAREYYYEILCRNGVVLPEGVIRHVEGCPLCQHQLHQLRDALIRSDSTFDAPDNSSDNKTLDALSRQFEFLGEQVTCSDVRPFLPGLLVVSSRVRIPTPITVHAEKCPQCAQDLAAIERLGLSDDQLERLGQFYSRSSFDDPRCEEQVFSATDPKTKPNPHGGACCSEIPPADLFDYVLPFDLDAAATNRANGRRDAVTEHLRTCRSCSERVQSLHRTIHGIAGRANSDVTTLYRCQDDAEQVWDAAQGDAHQYPVHVQIARPEPVTTDIRERLAASDARPSVRARRRPILQGTALTAAMVMLVGALFLMKGSTAAGTNIGDLLHAVSSKPNVHIAAFYTDSPLPVYEMWVSNDLNKIARTTGDEWVEYDLTTLSMRGAGSGLKPGVWVPLTKENAARCRKFMEEPLGDLFSTVRADDNLSQVDSVASDQPGTLLSVYELMQEQHTTNGKSVWNRCKAFIDPRLGLPVRIETSSRISENLPWEPTVTMRLSYPAASEIESEIKAKLPSE